MRINLPSAILLSGTVLLLSPLCAMANANEAATLEAGNTTATVAPAADASTAKAAETTATETKPADATGASAANPNQSAMSARSGMFRFGDQAEKNPIVDAPEAIEKAKAIHNQAMEQGKAKDLVNAMLTEQKAIDAAPHYWLPHAGMVYLMLSSKKKPAEMMKEASLSIYGKHNAVAERNAAKIFQMMRWNQPAVKALQAAIELEPNNWDSRIALADMQLNSGNAVEAKALLDKINIDSLTSYNALASVGAHHLSIDDYPKAKELLQKALTLAPDDAAKTECNDRLFIIAVKTHDDAMLKDSLGKIGDSFKKSRPDLVIQAKTRLAATPKDADEVFKEAANLQTKSPADVFFTIGREMYDRAQTMKTKNENPAEAKEWLVKSNQAFKNAITRDQNAVIYRVFDIASLTDLGDKPAVLTAYESFS